MAVTLRVRVGQVLYGALFAVALPLLLWGWARATRGVVRLPALHLPWAGALALAAGLALVAAGMAALWIHARGLPMNAFPPQKYVAQGVYRFVPHPIYAGFCLAVGGAAVLTGSASGLWLVLPATCAGCAALVLGYEGPALRRRFGPQPPPLLWLPARSEEPPDAWDLASAFLLAAAPWGLLYGAAILLGTPAHALSTFLPFEERWPVLEQAEALYASAYPLFALAFLAPRTRAALRALMAQVLLSSALVFPLYFTLPLVAPPRPFEAHSAWGVALLFERDLDTPGAAFPSFHVLFAVLAARALAQRWPRAAWAGWAWAAAISLSCLLTGQHSLLDVAAGALCAWACVRAGAVWEAVRAWAERASNSFRAARLGPARLLLHSAWGGAAAFAGVAAAGAMVGPAQSGAAVVAAAGGLLGAFLFARVVERPAALARPYGFWGGLLGIIAGSAAAPLFGADPWPLLAGFCAAGPLVQALGRVRCLAQGCCHGAAAPEGVGVRVEVPLSRVVKAGLGGQPIHATQLYSILWSIPCTLLLARLWWLQVPAHFLCGTYLLLAGLGRFVEEAYRGEPQTPVLGGLRFYQWMAIGALVAGAAITALGSSAPLPWPRLAPGPLLAAAACGLVAWLALGLDFPESQRRWSRLA